MRGVAEGLGSAEVACTIGWTRQVTSNLIGPAMRMSMLGPARLPSSLRCRRSEPMEIEAALIQAFRNAEENQEWVIGYFYEPQWFLSEVDLAHVDLPKWQKIVKESGAKVE